MGVRVGAVQNFITDIENYVIRPVFHRYKEWHCTAVLLWLKICVIMGGTKSTPC